MRTSSLPTTAASGLRLHLLIRLLVVLGALLQATLASEPQFQALRNSSVSVDGGLSRGVSWGDIDGDHWPDLVVGNTINQPDFLYVNDRNGGFSQVHEMPITLSAGWTEGVAWTDIDNDGDLDLFAARTDYSAMFRNDGDLRFARVQVPHLTDDEIEASEGCWGDYDGDGDLDLYLAVRNGRADRLYRNEGEWSFSLAKKGPWVDNGGDARSCAWGDADGDGDLDIYVGNFLDKTGTRPKKARNYFYRNEGNGTFSEVRGSPFVTVEALTYGVSWVDFDGDADLDLFMTNISPTDRNILYENAGGLHFVPREDLAVVLESRGPSKGHTWGDFDNDGDLDVFVANGTEGTDQVEGYDVANFLYLNEGNGTFRRIRKGSIVTDLNTSAGTACVDYDHDGDLDIFVANWGDSDEDNLLYRNDGPVGNWITVQLRGVTSNRYGIGARLEIVTGAGGDSRRQVRWNLPKTGYGSTNEPIIHFGLGSAREVRQMTIAWPSGAVDIFNNLAGNLRYVVAEGGDLAVSQDARGEGSL